jgi:hypothetical protein
MHPFVSSLSFALLSLCRTNIPNCALTGSMHHQSERVRSQQHPT